MLEIKKGRNYIVWSYALCFLKCSINCPSIDFSSIFMFGVRLSKLSFLIPSISMRSTAASCSWTRRNLQRGNRLNLRWNPPGLQQHQRVRGPLPSLPRTAGWRRRPQVRMSQDAVGYNSKWAYQWHIQYLSLTVRCHFHIFSLYLLFCYVQFYYYYFIAETVSRLIFLSIKKAKTSAGSCLSIWGFSNFSVFISWI